MRDNKRATRGVMVVRMRLVVLGLLAVGLIVGLSACMGFFQNTAQTPTLIIGKPAVSGNRGEVLISVTNMPNQGLASIQIGKVGNEAITFTNIDASSIKATGLNGFRVLTQDFATIAGKGCLLAVNPSAGSVGGTIVKITFEVTGANPALGIADADKGKVDLGTALNTLIAQGTWTLSSNAADYYAK